MSNEAEQSGQRRANLAALDALGVDIHPHRFDATHTVTALVEAHQATPAARARGGAGGDGGRRADRRHPQLRQGQLPRPVRRTVAAAGLPAPGRVERARLRRVAAARHRRSRRGGRPSLPHQDRRVVGVGVVAHVPGQVLPAAAREVARSERRRDALPPALSRSGGESRRAAGLRGAQPDRRGGARVPDRHAASSKSRRR